MSSTNLKRFEGIQYNESKQNQNTSNSDDELLNYLSQLNSKIKTVEKKEKKSDDSITSITSSLGDDFQQFMSTPIKKRQTVAEEKMTDKTNKISLDTKEIQLSPKWGKVILDQDFLVEEDILGIPEIIEKEKSTLNAIQIKKEIEPTVNSESYESDFTNDSISEASLLDATPVLDIKQPQSYSKSKVKSTNSISDDVKNKNHSSVNKSLKENEDIFFIKKRFSKSEIIGY
jgi:hypothetical protein